MEKLIFFLRKFHLQEEIVLQICVAGFYVDFLALFKTTQLLFEAYFFRQTKKYN